MVQRRQAEQGVGGVVERVGRDVGHGDGVMRRSALVDTSRCQGGIR